MNIIEAMQSVVGDVAVDAAVRESMATDKSIFKVVPEVVVFPKNEAEIVAVVKKVAALKQEGENVSLAVRAGGTCMSGGSLTTSVLLNTTKHMNKFEIDAKNKTARVEMGVMFKDLEDALTKEGLMFAPYPSSHRICGIGGMLGNNASGEKSIRHGATIDNVQSVRVVLASGEVIDTSKEITNAQMQAVATLCEAHHEELKNATGDVKKEASGYRLDKVTMQNITPLFIGAQGTLGIITEAVLSLVPIPQYTRLVFVPLHHVGQISGVVTTARAMGAEGIETFDAHTLTAANLVVPSEVEKLASFCGENKEVFLLVQFAEGDQKATDAQATAFVEKITASEVHPFFIQDQEVQEAAWAVRRASFTAMLALQHESVRAVPCIEDVIVPLEALADFIIELEKILDEEKITFGFHGHIGDGSLRVIPFFDFAQADVVEQITTLMQKVFALVKKYHGNISADHSDGIIRTPFVKEFYGEQIYSLFEQVKNTLDPLNIMNPNKKTSGTLTHIETYINTQYVV